MVSGVGSGGRCACGKIYDVSRNRSVSRERLTSEFSPHAGPHLKPANVRAKAPAEGASP